MDDVRRSSALKFLAAVHTGMESDRITREDLAATLAASGIDPARADIQAELDGYRLAGPIDCSGYADYAGPESVVVKALTNALAVPNWAQFCRDVTEIYEDVRDNVTGGANATYIPILAEADPNALGVAVCTVDGQQFQIGDWDGEFSIQSCVKPLMYAVAVEDHGVRRVHTRVGIEPSGLAFNEVSLNADRLPHNPMINSGAIASGSFVKPDADSPARFRYFMQKLSKLAGGESIGFSQPTYLCEHETAWRNNALMYYMQDAHVFPQSCNTEMVLDFYIQCCAIEVNARVAANIASTLANGGVNPLTKKKVLSPVTVKVTLTLMFSCGMYDYSGEWCISVGLPAKSGVAGLVYVVVPHVMGIAVWSPPLDSRGNSVKGIEFFKRLLQRYKFGIFDQIVSADHGVREGPRGPGPAGASASPKKSARVPDAAEAPSAFVVHDKARRLLRRFGALHTAFCSLAQSDESRPGTDHVDVDTVARMLQECGISVKTRDNRRVADLLARMHGGTGIVRFRDLFISDNSASNDNIVCRALLGELVIPAFQDFCVALGEVFESARHGPSGAVHPYLKNLSGSEYGMSVCSVDGQQYNYGDATRNFPLFSTIKPLLYAMALEDVSIDEVFKYVGNEPTASDPAGFSLLGGTKPFNPFMDSGALAVSALIGNGHGEAGARMFKDSGSRFMHIVRKLSQWAGGRKIHFNQPIFLAQQERSLRLKAVAHFMKGMGCFAEASDPTDVAKLYFQCCATEMSCETMAIVAATLANMGTCPTTGESCLSRTTMRQVLSVMYSCGMSQFSGKWNFSVGIPARGGETGGLLVVIPNVMGIALYSPPCNEYGVPLRGIAFCEQLTTSFRVNLFDQLVYADQDLQMEEKEEQTTEERNQATLLFFELCTASGKNDAARVSDLIARGAEVNAADYDRRTALHIACSDGAAQAVAVLLQAGANVLALDRWQTTPLDDARRCGHERIAEAMEQHLCGQSTAIFGEAHTFQALPPPDPTAPSELFPGPPADMSD